MSISRSAAAFVALASCLAMQGCGEGEDEPAVVRSRPANAIRPASPAPTPIEPGRPKAEPQSGHHHEAPHGGALAVIGDHLAHLEVVLDPPSGKLTLYFLDAEARGAVRLADETIPVVVVPLDGDGAGTGHEVTMLAIENALTGETRGATSQYEGIAPKLKGTTRFEVRIPRLMVRGLELTDFVCVYPEGNETVGGKASPDPDDHDHDHDHGDEHNH